jgi:hypothetical protein
MRLLIILTNFLEIGYRDILFINFFKENDMSKINNKNYCEIYKYNNEKYMKVDDVRLFLESIKKAIKKLSSSSSMYNIERNIIIDNIDTLFFN